MVENTKPHFKVVLVGNAAVGKTTIRKRFLGEGFQKTYSMTLGADFTIKSHKDFDLQIWDLAGIQQYKFIRRNYYENTNAALLVFDLGNSESLDNLGSWIEEVKKFAGEIPMLIIGNKSDLRKTQKSSMSPEQVKLKIQECSEKYETEFPYYETSAFNGENIKKVLSEILNYAYTEGSKTTLTS